MNPGDGAPSPADRGRLRRIRLLALLLAGAGAGTAALAGRAGLARGIALGAAIALLNQWWTQRLAFRVGASGAAPALMTFAFTAKLLLTGALVVLALKDGRFSPYGLLAGVTALPAGALVDALRRSPEREPEEREGN